MNRISPLRFIVGFGVVSALADLIIVPIIVIYRKCYGTAMALFLTGTSYLTMVAAGYFTRSSSQRCT